MILLAARDFHCRPDAMGDMPMFWIEWNFIVNRAMSRAAERKEKLARRNND